MAVYTINLEEVGKDEVLDTYEKVWEASALAHSIDMPYSFWVGSFLEAIIRSQEKVVELLGTLCVGCLGGLDVVEGEYTLHKPVACRH